MEFEEEILDLLKEIKQELRNIETTISNKSFDFVG